MVPFLLPVVLDFYRDPRRLPALRDAEKPLPAGVSELLSWVGSVNDETQIYGVAQQLGSSPKELLEAVRFFMKEALFRAEGDSYRTLGLDSDADFGQIKRHYRQLMSVFHPDRDASGNNWETDYAPLINDAYNALKRHHRGLAGVEPDNGWATTQRRQHVGTTPQSVAQPTSSGVTVPSATNTSRPKRKARKSSQTLNFKRWQTWLLLLRRRRIYVPTFAFVAIVIWATSISNTENDYASYGAPVTMTQSVPNVPVPDSSQTRSALETKALQLDAAASAEARRQAELAKRLAQEEQDAQRLAAQQAAEARRLAQQQAAEAEARRLAQRKAAEAEARRLAQQQAAEAEARRLVQQQAAEAEAQRLARQQAAEAEALRLAQQQAAEAKARRLAQQQAAEAEAEARRLAQQKAKEVERQQLAQLQLEQQRLAQQQAEEVAKKPVTDDQKVRALFNALAEAYEAEDAAAFARYFAANAVTPDATGRDAIRALYEDFFVAHSADEFRFINLRWKRIHLQSDQQVAEPSDYRVNANVSIVTSARDGSGGLATQIAITFDVIPLETGFVITRMEY